MNTVFKIQAPEFSKALLAELLTRPGGVEAEVSEKIKNLLTIADPEIKQSIEQTIGRMVIWADLSALLAKSEQIERQKWLTSTMRLLIVRGATYELINRLYSISRKNFGDLKDELGVGQHTRPPAIKSSLVIGIFNCWREISNLHAEEIDRWVEISRRYPHLKVSSIYQLIVKDAAAA